MKVGLGCPRLLQAVLLHILEEELPLLLVFCESEVEGLYQGDSSLSAMSFYNV